MNGVVCFGIIGADLVGGAADDGTVMGVQALHAVTSHGAGVEDVKVELVQRGDSRERRARYVRKWMEVETVDADDDSPCKDKSANEIENIVGGDIGGYQEVGRGIGNARLKPE